MFHPQAADQSCALGPSQATVSPTGELIFTGYCHPDGVRIYQLSPGPTPQVGILTSLISGQPNWLVDELAVDTTGREITFDLGRSPGGGDCVAGGGTVRDLDGATLAEHIEWEDHACPPGTRAVPQPVGEHPIPSTRVQRELANRRARSGHYRRAAYRSVATPTGNCGCVRSRSRLHRCRRRPSLAP